MTEAGPQGANAGACKWQGRLSRGTPMPPGYGHLTRHPPQKVTPTWGSHPVTNRRSRCHTRILGVQNPGANIITRCAGTKSHTYDESWHRIECHIFTI